MKRKKLCYLSALITFITLPLIALTIDSYALTFFDNEEEFLLSAPIADTEPFDGNAEGILPFTFSGTIFDDDIADPRLWRIASQPGGFGIPTTSNVLFTPGVQNDYFSFGTDNYVNAFGFFLFHPYHDETVGGIIIVEVTEIDGQVSTFFHNKDGEWSYFGFISDIGISQVKVYNSTDDNILDTNFAFDNISRGAILSILEPLITVTTPNGGEVLAAGDTYAITWTSEGEIDNVKIEYSVDDGTGWTEIVLSTVNNGSYDWDVPCNISTDSLVRISGLDSDASDTSDNVFSIIDDIDPNIDVSATPDVLWPPNHKMVHVTTTVTATDNCDTEPAIKLVSIVMDESDETITFDPDYDLSVNDGKTSDDIQIVDDYNFYLRSERSGKSDGRTYTITYKAVDESGNESTAYAEVFVPHSM